MHILLHSSKTMRTPAQPRQPLGVPALIPRSIKLVTIMRQTQNEQLQALMHISPKKAEAVRALYDEWSSNQVKQTPAIDAFVGDIYSGLQVKQWSDEDRAYAHNHLLILSGLYGGLRACDGVMPYRLEMGYKLPSGGSLYQFWGNSIASLIPLHETILLDLSAVEYTKAILPYFHGTVITPKFLTKRAKTGVPTFVTVHTKIARGAFARWVVQSRVEDAQQLTTFSDLGYVYDATESTPTEPVFVCDTFGGIGLSVRLTP